MGFWYEKWLTDSWCFYVGRICRPRFGLTVGLENDLYLGVIVIGLSKFS